MFLAHHRLSLIALCLLGISAAHAQQPPSTPASVDIALDASHRAGLASHRALMQAHGQTLDCTGVALTALLQKSGAMPATPLHGPQLAQVVDVEAADGYRVVFSLGELDASLGKTDVILADRCQGQLLDAHDGPLRLVVPGDSRPARSVRQVTRITVRAP